MIDQASSLWTGTASWIVPLLNLAVAVALAAFTYGLWRLEKQRNQARLRILSAERLGVGARLIVANDGFHDTGILKIEMTQAGPGTGQSTSWAAQTGEGEAQELVVKDIVRSGQAIELRIPFFIPPLLSNPGVQQTVRVTPVLGEPVEGPLDDGWIARKIREGGHGK